ncbi:predicted protein [Naegleria gruberi]|uniref:Predicted protein n=1 Tax=Naegleria gruberi TaxID=5762 RepID=D2VKX2_NAEGR|nr:uncharacterized protein NAEGRDRAFT_80381 [Naegleria gruberi]EFC42516.1 predicted protein [Naegleria gruberi]|eukprot:XP_002675260.1 predicted protein [Naegleria gruberi strain NEG-M]
MYKHSLSNLFIVGLLLCLLVGCVYSSQVVDNVLEKSGAKIETLPIGVTTKDQVAELHEFVVKPLVKVVANKIEKVAKEHPKEANQIKKDVNSLKQKLESRLRGQLNQKDAKKIMKQKQEELIAGIRSNLGL